MGKMENNENNLKSMGLTVTIVFKGSSLNYGESLGNVGELKKLTQSDGKQYPYLSRQALLYEIRRQSGNNNTQIVTTETKKKPEDTEKKEGGVLQYSEDATITEFTEIDLFGYMRTLKGEGSDIRKAVVRVSPAVALSPYRHDIDFLTNLGLLERLRRDSGTDSSGQFNNISQSEQHMGLYAYTVTVDLEDVGYSSKTGENIPNKEKANRVNNLLDTLMKLYRDIRGRREDISPLFIVGALTENKNSLFMNDVMVDEKSQALNVTRLKEKINRVEEEGNCVEVGYTDGTFYNNEEVKEEFSTKSVKEVMDNLKKAVEDYYGEQ